MPQLIDKDKDTKIPIIICHGISQKLSLSRFEKYLGIVSEMGY